MARRRRASKIEIVFETHSTTTDNERWVASGWLDGQLSPLGRRQARELGERRADDELVAVFCSDLGRAVETAQIAFGGRGLPIFHDWRLRECNYGMLNGTAVVDRMALAILENFQGDVPEALVPYGVPSRIGG